MEWSDEAVARWHRRSAERKERRESTDAMRGILNGLLIVAVFWVVVLAILFIAL
jgi:hypothetical protein